jgi:hypothetical protein
MLQLSQDHPTASHVDITHCTHYAALTFYFVSFHLPSSHIPRLSSHLTQPSHDTADPLKNNDVSSAPISHTSIPQRVTLKRQCKV